MVRKSNSSARFVVQEEPETGSVVVIDTAFVVERYTDANAQSNAEDRASVLNESVTQDRAEAAEDTVPSSAGPPVT